jgi:hypothetical protein
MFIRRVMMPDEHVWVVPKVGDWVIDAKEQVWRMTNQVAEGKIKVIRRNSSGRKIAAMKDITKLTVLDPSMAKLLTSVYKEK